jgi:GH24 family phage-related lysozyme (muramidase)
MPTYEQTVRRVIVPSVQQRLFQHEFSALVSLSFQFGSVPGSVRSAVNIGDFAGIMAAFLCYSGGGQFANRRRAEAGLFVNGRAV